MNVKVQYAMHTIHEVMISRSRESRAKNNKEKKSGAGRGVNDLKVAQ